MSPDTTLLAWDHTALGVAITQHGGHRGIMGWAPVHVIAAYRDTAGAYAKLGPALHRAGRYVGAITALEWATEWSRMLGREGGTGGTCPARHCTPVVSG